MAPRLTRYEVLGRLATGGMAEVWLARTKGVGGFEKLVVLKTILPELVGEPKFVTMFINEARLAAMLSHPNCVQIFDLGEEGDVLYIAMEYVEGFALSRVLMRARRLGVEVPEGVLARIAMDACSGLDYAHRLKDREGRPMGIVHRDISPDNLLISFAGQVKVVDFGIAKAASPALVGLHTSAGTVKGKHGYIAPESLLGQPVDGRADLFALGVVLYRALTGARPFTGDSESAVSLAVLEKDPPPPLALVPSLNPALSAVTMMSLQKDPAGRFDSARAMRQALETAVVRPAENEEVADFMHRLWPDDDPERAGLLALANGKSEERSSPVLSAVSDTDPEVKTATPHHPPLGAPLPATGPQLAISSVPIVTGSLLENDAPPLEVMAPALPATPRFEQLDAVFEAPPRRRRWPVVLALVVLVALAGAGFALKSPGGVRALFGRRAVTTGQVMINVPGLKVFDGTLELGTSPLAVDLAAGPHQLRFVNKAKGIDQVHEVTIEPGRVMQLSELPKKGAR